MNEIILEKRYPHSRSEDITDAFMRGYVKGKADRPQGKWAHQRNAFGIMEHKCSVCGVSFTTMDTYNFKYCFNCGASMKGADDEKSVQRM